MQEARWWTQLVNHPQALTGRAPSAVRLPQINFSKQLKSRKLVKGNFVRKFVYPESNASTPPPTHSSNAPTEQFNINRSPGQVEMSIRAPRRKLILTKGQSYWTTRFERRTVELVPTSDEESRAPDSGRASPKLDLHSQLPRATQHVVV